MPFTSTWTDVEMLILSEVSQKEKDKYHVISHMWNLKHDTDKLIYETETLTDIENRLVGATGEGRAGGMDWEFGISRRKLLSIGG